MTPKKSSMASVQSSSGSRAVSDALGRRAEVSMCAGAGTTGSCASMSVVDATCAFEDQKRSLLAKEREKVAEAEVKVDILLVGVERFRLVNLLRVSCRVC